MSYRITQATMDFLNSNGVTITGRDSNGWEFEIGSDIEYGDSFTLEALDGFKIISVTYVDENGWHESLTISSDGLTATNNSFDDTPLTDYNIETEAETVTPDYVLTESDLSSISDVGVLAVNDEPAFAGMGVNAGDVLTVIANDGVIIESITGRDENGFEIEWTVTPDGSSASHAYWIDLSFENLVIDTRGIQPEAVKGVNDVYVLSPDDMRTIITENFKFYDGTETTDYSKYLIGLIEIPFTIPDDIVEGDKIIQFGEYSTGVTGQLLTTDTLTVDMGSATIVSDKGNFLDYANTTAVLFLPYCDPITLENEYVINETISIEYVINLYDGLTNINISSSKNNSVIASRNVDLRASIPFGNVDSYPSNNSPFNIGLSGFNGITTPYIELLRNDAILEAGFFTIPIVDETELINCSGFITVNEIDLKTTATTQEKERIISQLNKGVIL